MDLLSIILPRRCVFCVRKSPEELCLACQDSLPWREAGNGGAGVVAPLYYKGAVRFALHRYKFRGASGYARLFGMLIAQAVRDSRAAADVVAWVPCGFFRRWSRGYDQSQRLARYAARELGLPLEKLLVKKRNAKSQTKMADDEARRGNVQGAFAASPAACGKRVLLLDDIYTSGATMEECRLQLLKAGAAEVVCAVLASRS